MATQNQIRLAQVLNEKAFQNERLMLQQHELAETRRSNLARENELRRSNLAHESLGWANYQEGVRSNLARERELFRSNSAREAQGWVNANNSTRMVAIEASRAEEQARRNRESERIDRFRASEDRRHSKAMESIQRTRNSNEAFWHSVENKNDAKRIDLMQWKNKRDNIWTGIDTLSHAGARISREMRGWVNP